MKKLKLRKDIGQITFGTLLMSGIASSIFAAYVEMFEKNMSPFWFFLTIAFITLVCFGITIKIHNQ